MTWYPRKVERSTRQAFNDAKEAKHSIPREVNCILCFGNGEKYDSKLGKIRPCAGCKGTGKMKNPKYTHRHA